MRIILKPAGAITVVLLLIVLAGLAMMANLRGKGQGQDGASGSAGAPVASHWDHPIAFWKMEEGHGKTIQDSAVGDSAAKNTGTLQGDVAWSDSGIGTHCLNFTGSTTGFVDIPRPVVDTGKSYSVSACVQLKNIIGFQTIVGIDGDQVSSFYLQLRGEGGKFGFAALPGDSASNNTPAHADALDKPEIGKWYHLIGVYDATAHTMSLYVNGTLAQTVPQTSAWKANGHTIIGRGKFENKSVDFVDGQVDNVRFYDTALNVQDALALAKQDLPEDKRK